MSDGLTVDLGSKSYPIHFIGDPASVVRAGVDKALRQGRTCVMLTDEGVAKAQGAFLDQGFGSVPRLTFAAGEKAKSLENFGRVQDFLATNKVSRQGLLWVVGGGVMGDL